MAHFSLRPMAFSDLTSIDLANEARQHADNPTVEAYKVFIDGQAQSAECLYFGDRDIAGIAWGADANWHEHVGSAQEACEQEFGDMA